MSCATGLSDAISSVDDRRAQDLDRLGERRRLEHAARGRRPRAGRRPGRRRGRTGTIRRRGWPTRERRADRRARRAAPGAASSPASVRNSRCGARSGGGQDGLGHPAAGQRLVIASAGARLSVIQARSIGSSMIAGVAALQPVVPPAQHLLQEADLRARAARNADRHAPRARSAPCAAPSDARAGAGSRWCSRRSSRRPHRPGTRSRA